MILFPNSEGNGLMWKNIMGTLGVSLNFKNSSQLIIAWSLSGTLARFCIGFVTDFFRKKGKFRLFCVIIPNH
jgi:hypothetical protein